LLFLNAASAGKSWGARYARDAFCGRGELLRNFGSYQFFNDNESLAAGAAKSLHRLFTPMGRLNFLINQRPKFS